VPVCRTPPGIAGPHACARSATPCYASSRSSGTPRMPFRRALPQSAVPVAGQTPARRSRAEVRTSPLGDSAGGMLDGVVTSTMISLA
jgi:hypothetical protein